MNKNTYMYIEFYMTSSMHQNTVIEIKLTVVNATYKLSFV